jgi:hypothetical protein
MQSNFAQTNALGRTAPVYTFSNSGPRTVQIGLPLHRDIMDEVNIGISNVFLGEGEDYIDNLLKFFTPTVFNIKYRIKSINPNTIVKINNTITVGSIVAIAIDIPIVIIRINIPSIT